jgi:perosamine synthetase
MIKLAQPTIPEDAIEKVADVLRSGNLIQGQYVEAFEGALKAYVDVPYAIAVSSGTAALHLSLLALDIASGDEVIVPAFTFPATVNVVELVGAKPVLVDIRPDDLCMDASALEKAITDRTRAILPVHEFGQAAGISEILSLARRRSVPVIEDAACALGTEFDGEKAGTFGLTGCFSFHPRKAITTGEGGAVTTGSEALYEKIRSLRNHGISTASGTPDFIHAGLNYRMTEFQAVLGLFQMGNIDHAIEQRIHLADLYDQALADISWLTAPHRNTRSKHVFQTYHVMLDPKIDRQQLISHLRSAGIETNLGAQAIHCLTYYRKKYHFRPSDFPNSARAYSCGLALPMGSHISRDDILYIAERLAGYSG